MRSQFLTGKSGWIGLLAGFGLAALLSAPQSGFGQANDTKSDAAAATYFSGNALFNRGLFDLALGDYKKFLAANPKHEKVPNAQLGLALCYFKLSQFKEAEPVLEKLAANPKAPEREQVHLMWGQALLEAKNYPGAETAFRKGLAIAKGNEPMRAGLVDALFQQKDWKEVVVESAPIAKGKGEFALYANYRGALAQFELKQFKEAVEGLTVVKATAPKETTYRHDAIYFLAECHRELGNLNAAADAYEMAAREVKGPHSAEAYYRLGYALFTQKKYSDAATELAKLRADLKGTAQAAKAGVLLGRAQLEGKKWKEAEATFSLLASTGTADAELSLWHARTFQRQAKHAEAAAVLAKVLPKLAKDPLYSEVLFDLGENQFFAEKHSDAVAAFEKYLASEKNPSYASIAKFRIGQSRYLQQNWAEALKQLLPLSKAKDLSGPLANIGFLIGDCHFQLKEWREAASVLGKFADENKSHQDADTALIKSALALESDGKRAESVMALSKLVKGFSDSRHHAHALLETGRIQYISGKYAEARAALELLGKKHTASPHRPTAEYWLGWTAKGEGKLDEAATLFGKMADQFPKHEMASEARLQQALALLQRNENTKAQVVLERFQKDYPNDAAGDKVSYNLAMALSRQQQWEPALKMFQKVIAIKNSPLRERAMYESAWCEKGSGRNPQAALRYQEQIAAYPKGEMTASATLELADLEVTAKQYADAAKRLKPLIAAGGDESAVAKAQFLLGWCHYHQKEFALSAKAFEAAIDAAPAELVPRAAYQAGEARMQLKEYSAAFQGYSKVLAAKSGPVELALLRAGECQGLLGKWDEAAKVSAEFLAKHASHANVRRARMNHGWALQNLKKTIDAADEYRKVLASGEADEIGARSQFLLGECLLAQKKYDEAIREFVKVEITFAYPEWQSMALLQTGQALEFKGDKVKAAEHYRLVMAEYPKTDAAILAKQRLK
ncbi:MAG: tetratricopeptide repeat protein [Pedosphaera sp.]|nr:tetratricopeptide repeat protein [Pedosphaera sp.]